MRKHSFIVIDEDENFMESVTSFLAISSYASIVEIKAFTSLEAAEQTLQKAPGNPLVIVAETMLLHKPQGWMYKLAILANDAPGTREPSDFVPGQPLRIHKYQSLVRLLEQLCKYDDALLTANKELSDRRSKAQTIAVYASSGGAGKTTVALNLARTLSIRRQKTLYVSLESLCGVQAVLKGETSMQEDEGEFSKLIYFLKTNPGKLQDRLNSFINIDTATGLHYIAPLRAVREMEAMDENTAKELIHAMVSSNRYERIVFDMDSALHPRTICALEQSEEVIWLIQPDEEALMKAQSALRQLTALQSIHWVVNKHMGAAFDLEAFAGMKPDYFLPYVPEWKTLVKSNERFSHRAFSESIAVLASSVCSLDFPARRAML